MVHALSLGLTLFVLWLLLSGIYVPLLLGLGVFSCLLVLFIALRMDVVDHEGRPVHLRFRGWLVYMGWLAVEIVKSSIDVARAIVHPAMPIRPRVMRVECSQATELGTVIYANSITLTPGTVSIDFDGDVIVVHALTPAGAAGLESGEMDRRVTALEHGR